MKIINTEIENKILATFEEQARRIRDASLKAGVKSMCGVILEKIKELEKNNEPPENIIKEIKDFCERNIWEIVNK